MRSCVCPSMRQYIVPGQMVKIHGRRSIFDGSLVDVIVIVLIVVDAVVAIIADHFLSVLYCYQRSGRCHKRKVCLPF